jgi:nitrogen fixation/metabolism regulation signal transduction histidine kinase
MLVFQHGDFQYKLNTEDINDFEDEFTIFSRNDFNHLVYKTANNTFIVSIPKVTFLDYLAVYSYLFVFFFILMSAGLIFTNQRIRISLFNFNLKSKIQYSMIGILVLSLFTIGIGTIVLNINKSNKAYTDEIGEKTQSISVELQHKFGNYTKFSKGDDEYLKYLFEKWSYVFFTDINFYNTNGDLITSSRMEVFDKNLTGRKMNKEAYIKVKINSNTEFIHKEKIGNLSFMSAYIPFLNEENKVLAYLNIPYFTKQSKITNETYELIVTLLNIYVLLFILSIFIAVIISQNITKPLLLIQKHIGHINLLKNNEPIHYNKKDEIGALVQEYNNIIEELEQSALLLAKSERESAWREMAKQIAHEIKNPLTPIKLNIQFLQKSWNNKDDDFDKKLDRISNTIIEQINSLSKIASDFSDFANIAKSKKEIVDIYKKIQTVAQLFEQTNNLKITIQNTCLQATNIFADKEQIIQVFNNLFKNAIQSVETNQNVEINVEILENTNDYIIKVNDNGKGIPKNIQDKLFKPNFTTKSSGMGLGLAIVKRIIESSNGKIYFQTKLNKGTTFFIEFPKIG